MKSYAKAKNHRAHARTQRPAPAQQPPEVEHRKNAGWLKLWRTVYPNTPPPTAPTRKAQGSGFKVRPPSGVHPPQYCYEGRVLVRRTGGSTVRLPAAVERLASFLSVSLTLALLATGCAGPRPLKGGKAVTTHKPGGVIEQTLVQSENPAAATKQTQESVKVRTYTLPTGSRIEQSQLPVAVAAPPSTLNYPSTIASAAVDQPPIHHSFSGGGSTSFVLSAPMPVVEREETHARTELGAAQKDTARELGAKLSSLKGIVWVGVGLFVFGLASLVYPPLKVIIGSVTTSAALMLGGVALMVLPSLIVGNELLILGCVGVAVGGWFLAHRHGQLRGIVAATANALGGQASPRAQTSSLQDSQCSPSQDHS